jgi:hypothetical protein
MLKQHPARGMCPARRINSGFRCVILMKNPAGQ